MTPRPPVVLTVGTFVAIAIAAVTAGIRLGGDSAEHPFTSDSAIPLLMSNAETWTPFHLYYFGQDRFGALPFSIASLVHVVTGLRWTPFSLGFAQVLACFAGAFAFGKLTRSPVFFACAYAVIVTTTTRFLHFDIAQPYGWQLALVFAAWLSIRRARELSTPPRIALATFVSFLACWQSAMSGPLLLGVAVVEAAMAHSPNWKRRLLLLIPPLVGGGLEGVLRGSYQVYTKRTFGHSYRTHLELTLDGILQAFWDLANNPVGPGLFFIAISVAVAFVAVMLLVRAARRGNAGEDQSNALVAATLGPLVIGQLLMIAAFSHFRENGLDGRYLLIAEMMAKLSAAIVLYEVGRRVHRHGELALSVAAVVLVAAAPLWVRDFGRDAEQPKLRNIAVALTEGRGPMHLLSVYWEVYAVAAMHPTGAITPVTLRHNYHRTPFTDWTVKEQASVWLGRNTDDGEQMGGVDPELTFEGGVLLQREPDLALVVEGRRFLLYRPVPSRLLRREPVKTCDVEQQLPARRGMLLGLVNVESRPVSAGFIPTDGPRTALRSILKTVYDAHYLAPSDGTFTFATTKTPEGKCLAYEAQLIAPAEADETGSIAPTP